MEELNRRLSLARRTLGTLREVLAEEIYSRLRRYLDLIDGWLDAMERRGDQA